MRNTKKAFTLVELIVVITILAILGTIAFISLQWYSSDARNSKRTSDLNSVVSAVSTAQTKGTPILSLVDTVTANTLTTINIAWTGATDGTNYEAGTPNYVALEVKEDDFKDPNGDEYVMGVTTKISGKYEIAASMENGSWEETAKVQWTYVPRTTAISLTVSNMASTNSVTIADADINRLQRGDTVGDGTSTGTTIVAVSADGKTLTLSDTTLTGTTLNLGSVETAWLIAKVAPTPSTTTAVTNNGTNLPY